MAASYGARPSFYRRFAQCIVAVLVLALSSQTHGMGSAYLYEKEELSASERERASMVVGSSISLQSLESKTPLLLGSIVTEVKVPDQTVKYAVATGDTLSSIADRYGLHIGTIMLANPSLRSSNLIEVGNELVIPAQDASSEELAKEYAERARRYSSVALADAPATQSKTVKASSTVASTAGSFGSPLSAYTYVSQAYSRRHGGIDYATPSGTSVYAAADGCISLTATGWNGGYGTMVKMDNGGGISTLYAHLSRLALPAGSCVAKGTLIAYSGNTGRSTGPHLHFEVRESDIPINPTAYVR